MGHLPEACTPPAPLEQINQWYRAVPAARRHVAGAGRVAGPPPGGPHLQDVQAYILSSSEYYDRLGNQNGRYLAELYRNLFGRQPTASGAVAVPEPVPTVRRGPQPVRAGSDAAPTGAVREFCARAGFHFRVQKSPILHWPRTRRGRDFRGSARSSELQKSLTLARACEVVARGLLF